MEHLVFQYLVSVLTGLSPILHLTPGVMCYTSCFLQACHNSVVLLRAASTLGYLSADLTARISLSRARDYSSSAGAAVADRGL